MLKFRYNIEASKERGRKHKQNSMFRKYERVKDSMSTKLFLLHVFSVRNLCAGLSGLFDQPQLCRAEAWQRISPSASWLENK